MKRHRTNMGPGFFDSYPTLVTGMTSPLTPEERAALRERVDELREDGHKRLPDWVDRLLDERDSIARDLADLVTQVEVARDESVARIRAAEAERDEALAQLERARAAVDAWWPTVYYPPTAVERAVRAALAPGGGA